MKTRKYLRSLNSIEPVESEKNVQLAIIAEANNATAVAKQAIEKRLKRECSELHDAGTPSVTCDNLDAMIKKGDLLQEYNRKNPTNSKTLLSPDVAASDVLFTDPYSEEYCLQSYSLSRFDINPEILKLRFTKYNHLCGDYMYTQDPVEVDKTARVFSKSKYIMKQIRAIVYVTNSTNEIYNLHRSFFLLMIARNRLNETTSYKDSGADFVNALVYNQTLEPSKMEVIKAVKFIPLVYVSMLCEEYRMDLADKLLTVLDSYQEILRIVSRYSLRQIENIYKTLIKQDIQFFITYSDRMLDTTTALDIENLNFLTAQKGLVIRDAMEFVGHFSTETLRNWSFPLLDPYVTTVKLFNRCNAGNAENIMDSLRKKQIQWPPFLKTAQCSELSQSVVASHENLLGKHLHTHYHKVTGEIEPAVLLPVALLSIGTALLVGIYVCKRINLIKPIRQMFFGDGKSKQIAVAHSIQQPNQTLRLTGM